ncbi:Digalactosyldiacylglycerol synthase 2 [Hibiscus syriacus]|uniref:Digalactosyldiacylglycerol synthase 2, chloroplastic n=1 Tax=Hibiscus syriacus TaxID=106335 RepID=A0A6A3D0S4_HIBSY|nr:Digalactosyldiacylglycerol synthase 2 [Hibiscus syriacus]
MPTEFSNNDEQRSRETEIPLWGRPTPPVSLLCDSQAAICVVKNQAFTKGAYYIGKMIWSKGYGELFKLVHDHQNELAGLEVDLYGNGEVSDQVKEAASKLKLTLRVLPGHDHADPLFHDYKVFLNPSTTDVVYTTAAEALAMGKIVVCVNHPSNDFFKQFPNCRIYDDENCFVEVTRKALSEEPVPLTDAQRRELSWEAATERFLRVSELNQDTSAYVHHLTLGFEATRRAFGAIPGRLQPDEEQVPQKTIYKIHYTWPSSDSIWIRVSHLSITSFPKQVPSSDASSPQLLHASQRSIFMATTTKSTIQKQVSPIGLGKKPKIKEAISISTGV